jgi:hypothetical protein
MMAADAFTEITQMAKAMTSLRFVIFLLLNQCFAALELPCSPSALHQLSHGRQLAVRVFRLLRAVMQATNGKPVSPVELKGFGAWRTFHTGKVPPNRLIAIRACYESRTWAAVGHSAALLSAVSGAPTNFVVQGLQWFGHGGADSRLQYRCSMRLL